MHTSSYDYTFGDTYKVEDYRMEAEQDALVEVATNKKEKLRHKIGKRLVRLGSQIAGEQ